tara:strand:+ start:216 stop:365 length:150 start_codon:yes stop_codon:yes gene_type:complete
VTNHPYISSKKPTNSKSTDNQGRLLLLKSSVTPQKSMTSNKEAEVKLLI